MSQQETLGPGDEFNGGADVHPVVTGESEFQGGVLASAAEVPHVTEEEAKLAALVNIVIDSYASRAMPILRDKVRRGEDKAEIKLAAGKTYKLGDVEITIDPIGENILHELVDAIGLPAVIHGEHQAFPSPTGEDEIHFAIDPFDNTAEYNAGLDTPPWTVLSAYDKDGKPVASLVGNIKESRAYMLQNGRVFEKDLESGEKREIRKSTRESLLEDSSVMASYIGSSEYSSKFNREFGDFIESRPEKAIFYGGGGAYIYGPLAAGRVDAYVMFDEPYEEIDPGAAIALAAGCVIGHYSLEKDMWIPYKYDPNRKDDVVKGVWIAAANKDIVVQTIEHIRAKRSLEPGGWDAFLAA